MHVINDECRFGPSLVLKSGERVLISTREGQTTLRGKLTQDVTTGNALFKINIDGTSGSVTFQRGQWIMTLLDPDIEDGIYVGIGNVYRVVGNVISGTDATLGNPALGSLYTRKRFSEHVKAGKIRRVAEAHGSWL